uniref:DNA binding protein n=1 Tax=Solanum tuberosum TaxID=4113 RepID=M1AY30_SOLTU
MQNYGSLDSIDPTKVIVEKDLGSVYSSLLSEIDHTVKKYADNLLHAVEGVSARLSQLETRNRQIDNSVDELKLSVGNSHGVTDGKLRQLENILREVPLDLRFINLSFN